MKNITLSKRMETVVNMVSPRSFAIADIGCDHAYISIALLERRLAEKVIAMDVRPGPLEIARKNVAYYGMEDRIELRMSDGLERLSKEEADVIIIAGMGGLLMKGILERGRKILEWEKKRPSLILQPQSDIHEVRIFLQEHAYHIVQEKMLMDEGKYYTVIKAEPRKVDRQYTDTELRYGSYSLEHRDMVLYEYLKKEKKVLENIFIKLADVVENAKAKGEFVPDKTIKRLAAVEKERDMNSRALEYYVNQEECK